MSALQQPHPLCQKCDLKRGIVIDSFIPGDIIIIHGLKNKPKWNHNKAIIIQYVSTKNRYVIQILSYYHKNIQQKALLKPENMAFVSKQRYINNFEGKISKEDNNDTKVTWKIPKKSLKIYNTLNQDCGYFSPIFIYKGMLFIFQLLPNGYCRADKTFTPCYQYQNNSSLVVTTINNEKYVSIILTLLSKPYNIKQIELNYCIQINKLPDSYRQYHQTFHNDKTQSIWQRITTTNMLKQLKKLTITATFKSSSIKTNKIMHSLRSYNEPLHFSWNLNTKTLLTAIPCNTHNLQNVDGPIFKHNNFEWRLSFIRAHDSSKLALMLIKYPDSMLYIKVNVIIKCSQLNIGAMFTNTYHIKDHKEFLAAAASFCSPLFLKSNMNTNKLLTFECILVILECKDITRNMISMKPKLQSDKTELIIANCLRNNKCNDIEIESLITDYLVPSKKMIDRIMNFEKDDKLKGLLNSYPNAKCIDVMLLDEKESKPFISKFSSFQQIEHLWLATFEDTKTSNKPLFNHRRASEIIWECRSNDNKLVLMPEMGQLDVVFFTTNSSTDCIQFTLIKDGDWITAPLSISYFHPNRRNRDFEETFKIVLSCMKIDKMSDPTDENKKNEQRPIGFRSWNPGIMQYDDFDVIQQIQHNDYWNIVERNLEGLYLRYWATKMFKSVK